MTPRHLWSLNAPGLAQEAPRSAWAAARLLLAAMLSVGALGCASLPEVPPAAPVVAIAPDPQTPLAQMTAKVLPGDGRSGFRLLPYGPNAFATRIAILNQARSSIDLQYFVLKGDNVGCSLMRALRQAAERGVRVRLLVDDLRTAGDDDLFLALAALPNVQVRLFNPFPAGRATLATRLMASVFDFARVDRRMHNKLLIADNAVAVTGGRNIADEYMLNSEGSNFVDMDVFAAGPVVRQLSEEFDHYWNSDVVYPVERVAHSPLIPAERRRHLEACTAVARGPFAMRVAGNDAQGWAPDGAPLALSPELASMLTMPFELEQGELNPLLWGDARVLFDPVRKTAGWNETHDTLDGTVTQEVLRWLASARQEIKLVSPYFVPGDIGMAAMADAHRRRVSVRLVTNSLASTDEPWVYGAYWPHIPAMLAADVEIFELSPSLSVSRRRFGIFGHRTGALHMKNAIVDHRQVFLGSMNFDRRSAMLNTELGLIIDSPEMARQLEKFADEGSTYRLRLSADRTTVLWVEPHDDGTETIHDTPPETSAWLRFKLRVLGPLIPAKEL